MLGCTPRIHNVDAISALTQTRRQRRPSRTQLTQGTSCIRRCVIVTPALKKMQVPLLTQVSPTLVGQVLGALRTRCPYSQWAQHGNTCYIIPDGPRRTWHDGRQLCHSRGGDLVLPRSREENDFVHETMAQIYNGDSSNNIWIRCFFDAEKWDCAKDPVEYTN